MDDHSSGTPVAGRFAQPTRTAGAETPWAQSPRRPYSVLLPVGFALPPPLPEARCALAAPFHPCGQANPPRGIISVALSLGSPPPGVTRHRVSMEPGLSSPPANTRRTNGAAARPPDNKVNMLSGAAPSSVRAIGAVPPQVKSLPRLPAGPSAAGPSAAGPSAAGPSAAGPSAASPSGRRPQAALSPLRIRAWTLPQ